MREYDKIVCVGVACIVWEDVSQAARSKTGLHDFILVDGHGVEYLAKTRLSPAELEPYRAYSQRGAQPQPLNIKQVASFIGYRSRAGNLIIEKAIPAKPLRDNQKQRDYPIRQYEALKAATPALYE